MDDTLCQRFFLEPDQPLHRRYAALPAYFMDGLSFPAMRRAVRLDLPHRAFLGPRLSVLPARPARFPLFAALPVLGTASPQSATPEPRSNPTSQPPPTPANWA